MNININQVNHIGSKIKHLMENKNEDSKMLAPLMGISESQLNRLLADRYRWTEEKVMWFANRYNVSFLSLFLVSQMMISKNTENQSSCIWYQMHWIRLMIFH